ncbi:MAG: zinc-dependent metalloprotease [Chitinophagales bacterium]
MRQVYTLLLITLWAVIAVAQPKAKIHCGYEAAMQRMESRFPGFRVAADRTFAESKQAAVSANSRSVNYDIGIVFHVLYDSAAENLGDSVLFSEIAVLNEDYSHTNADAGNARPIFDTVSGDTHIRFHIKQINRVHSTASFTSLFGFPEDSIVKETANGGDDAVAPEHYLNIWILNIKSSFLGSVLGFAYPPAGLSNWPSGSEAQYQKWEGVVVDYRTVGRNNPNPYPDPTGGSGNLVIKGRTCTHEVGHYLGLRHIWGDGGGFSGTNDCLQSDGIDDTPFANSQSDFDCNTSRNTCGGIETYYGINAPDMIENYMDYSSESCMNMFTRQQGALMRSTIENQRTHLLDVAGVSSVVLPQVHISPNPSNGTFLITGAGDHATIEVFSLLGKQIASLVEKTAGNYTVDLTGNAAGIYMLQIKAGNSIKTEKVILQ